MSKIVSDIAFSPAVKAVQEGKGSRRGYARMEEKGGWKGTVDDELAAFLARRDSFYLATVSAAVQPYVQHRGGPPGFLKIIDDKTLAFADYTGNRQYITVGNLSENDKAQIFLMDYANQRRVKIWGRARVVEGDADLMARLTKAGADAADAPAGGSPELAIVFDVHAWDINCPQHITPRFTEAQVGGVIDPLKQRIAELETELEDLKVLSAARDRS